MPQNSPNSVQRNEGLHRFTIQGSFLNNQKKTLTTLTTETSLLPQGLDRFGFGAVPNSFLPRPRVIGLTGERAKKYVFRESASDEILGSYTNQNGGVLVGFLSFFLFGKTNFVKSSDDSVRNLWRQ